MTFKNLDFSNNLTPPFRQTKEYASCEIITTPMKGDRKPSAFGFQKDSPYLDLFNSYLKEMQEKGAIGEILKDIMPENCRNYSL